MIKNPLYISILVTWLVTTFFPLNIYGQNISGENVYVSSLSLTVLKFNSKITHYEFDDKENFSGQVRNGDNSFVIRVNGTPLANTNLYLSEGKRGHWFVVNYLAEDIDLNKVKLFQDFSDLKYLKNLVKQEEELQAKNLTKPNNSDNTLEKKKEIVANAQKDSINFQKAEEKRLAERKKQLEKQKEIEAQILANHLADSIAQVKEILAKNERLKKEEEARQKEKLIQLARSQHITDSLNARKAEEALALAKAKLEVEKQQQELAILTARNKVIADSLKAEKEKDAKIAKTKEMEIKQKAIAEEEKRNKWIADSLKVQKLENDKKIAQAKKDAEKRQQELAIRAKYEQHLIDSLKEKRKEEEKLAITQKLEEKRKLDKQRNDSIAAIPKVYTHAELFKKYPQFVFEQPPVGQSLTTDYFDKKDTSDNYEVSMNILNNLVINDALVEPLISNTDNHAYFELKSINFSGVNCFMRILVNNNNKSDYLVGPIVAKWEQYEGKVYNLYPCYITEFPVLSPNAKKEIILVTRAINIQDADILKLNIGDRMNNTQLQIKIPGYLYNQQYEIIRELKETY